MNKKRISAAALALAMTASVSVSALANESNGAVDGVRLPENNSNEYGIALINSENGGASLQPVGGMEGFVVNDGVQTDVTEGGTLVVTPDGTPVVDGNVGADAGFDAGFAVDAEIIPEFYNGVVSINGEEILSVDFTYNKVGDWQEYHRVKNVGELPGAPAGYIPMRLFCQAAGGTATFYDTEGFSSFYVNGTLIYTDYNTGAVSVMNEDFEKVVQEGVSFYFDNGVTFLPISFIETLPRVSVYTYTFDGQEIFDIEIAPEGTPLDQLVSAVYNSSAAPGSIMLDADTLQMLTDVDFNTCFEEFSGLMAAMSAQSNVTLIGKYAEGVDKEAAQAALQKIQQYQINANTFYAEPLALAEAGKIVESADGKYVMIVISGDNDAAITAFQDGVLGLDQADTGIMPR